ncbi:hypothetical protein DPEC_G00264690 [Dallia pectoralis]|uniref:Uncharacterized protein n=1 Tax=Dallia pectoralis TaxID=75939 RepID=A0ACC2FSH2_DALPE|nr:hypothetical protein DPEC_G00264690 [Dallia pectoralis]
MRLWDVLSTCNAAVTCTVLLLSCVHASPPRLHPLATETTRARDNIARGRLKSHTGISGETDRSRQLSAQQYNLEELHPEQFKDALDFIKVTIARLRSYSHLDMGSRIRRKRERRKGRRGKVSGSRGGRLTGGREQGCVLKQIHLNVTDLGLGYQTSEELIFRYCSGPCRTSETNYDKILNSLSQNKRLRSEKPSHACCRPVAYDDDLSFLDDHLMYHTMKKHSARRCGCV